MKKNNGFTLVELLAVIVILGLLMVVAIPSVLKISRNVKEKSYTTKIDIIESGAVTYGEKHSIDILKKEKSELSGLWISVEEDTVDKNVSPGDSGTYPAVELKVDDLVKSKNLSYDDEDGGFVVDPVTNKSINNCSIYIYYRNNRVYAKFDRTVCDENEDTI